jgi:GNAT superfamily N-acetyltransferase
MTTRAVVRPEIGGGDWNLEPMANPSCDAYRALYQSVGTEWLWSSRLVMDEAALTEILASPDVEVHRLTARDGGQGILELDFRQRGECELAYFGIEESLVGQGAGRWLMNKAIKRAWMRPIERFWVHTCTLDHPAALPFYIRSGFTPFRQQVEVEDDPRLIGVLPKAAAPRIPLAFRQSPAA